MLKRKGDTINWVTLYSILSQRVIVLKDVIREINETQTWTVLYRIEFSDVRCSDFDNTCKIMSLFFEVLYQNIKL